MPCDFSGVFANPVLNPYTPNSERKEIALVQEPGGPQNNRQLHTRKMRNERRRNGREPVLARKEKYHRTEVKIMIRSAGLFSTSP